MEMENWVWVTILLLTPSTNNLFQLQDSLHILLDGAIIWSRTNTAQENQMRSFWVKNVVLAWHFG